MATAGIHWPGAARSLGLALATGLVTTAMTTGCGGAGGAEAKGTPSPSATPPEVLCTRIVAHWSREVLDSDTYGDYQSMGLSNGQYGILRTVVDAARAERERRGAEAADALIDREARAGCEKWYRSGGPGRGPWQ
ncbi:hypothetical protein ACIBBD_22680 [Streptomyces sp. NPDC051315]|uniref:hypothetical protein n=1 Tax=Streptomyces sp. NPDC051315 TaxID=3365650 RepID=UPI0037BD3C5A